MKTYWRWYRKKEVIKSVLEGRRFLMSPHQNPGNYFLIFKVAIPEIWKIGEEMIDIGNKIMISVLVEMVRKSDVMLPIKHKKT